MDETSEFLEKFPWIIARICRQTFKRRSTYCIGDLFDQKITVSNESVTLVSWMLPSFE